MCERMGLSRSEVLGRTPHELLLRSVADELRANDERVLASGEAVVTEEFTLQSDGLHVFKTSTCPVFDEEGRVIGVGGLSADITDRKRVESEMLAERASDVSMTERLREESRRGDERLRQLVESAHDFIWEVDKDGAYTFVSHQSVDILGYEPAEMIGKVPFDFMPREEAARTTLEFGAIVISRGLFRDLRNVNLHKDGRLVVLETNGVPFFDANGDLAGYRGTDRDITKRVVAESALRESEALLEQSQRVAQVGHFLLDFRSGTWTSSAVLDEIYGIDEGYVRNIESWLAIVHPDDRGKMFADFEQNVMRDHKPTDREYRIVSIADGAEKAVRGIATPEFSADGEPLRMFGIIQDITERRQDLERLRRALASTVEIVSQIAEARDPFTAGHQRRVSELAVQISRDMGMSAQQTEEIRITALMHDIGRMSIPADILSKPGRLTPLEFALIKGHSEAGYNIIVSADMEGQTAEIVYQHHERCDGSGYPRGLTEDQLLPESKVLMVADVVEAMMSHRPYRPALGVDAALAEIERGAGTLYCADVSRSCLAVFREHGFVFSEG